MKIPEEDLPDFVITLSHFRSGEEYVTLAFTLGLASLKKGHKTGIILLFEGIQVGTAGCVDNIDIGEPFLPVKEMLPVYLEQGGQLFICGSCWQHGRIPDGERLIGTTLITPDNVIDLLMNAKSSIQLN